MAILIIEDDWVQQNIIEDSFGCLGLELLQATDGESAERFLKEKWNDIELVISDVLLPLDDKPGAEMTKEVCYQLGRKIKEKMEGDKRPRPLILITVYGEEIIEEFREKTKLKESVYFFRKPFDVERLVEKIKALLAIERGQK